MTAILALSPRDVDARMSGTPEERAGFVREVAEAGSAAAQTTFGRMLLDGTGVAADPQAALGWFAAAAEQGDAVAMHLIGRCHRRGWGTPADKDRAADAFAAAAARGLPEAMYDFALALALGEGVVEDRPAALGWLERAAAAGFIRADDALGRFAEEGWVDPRDMNRAAARYARAAEGGDCGGCFNHARMLAASGDVAAAVPWIARAAALGHQRFRERIRDWLAGTAEPLRSRGLAAI